MDMLCVRWWSDAGPAVRSGVDKYIYNAESPKQGSKRFNFFRKAIHFAHLGILFIYVRNDAVANDKVGSVQATDGDGTAPGNLVRYQIGQLSFCYKNSYSIASRRVRYCKRHVLIKP